MTIDELQKRVEKLERELAELRTRVSDHEGVYILNDEEKRAVEEGLADRLATDEEVSAVYSKYGLQSTL